MVDHCLCSDLECVANAADIPWEFIEPWNTCIICKQSFQDQLSLDLTSACVSFAESKYSHNHYRDKLRVMAVLRHKLLFSADIAISNFCAPDHVGIIKNECEMLFKRLLAMIEQMKKDMKMTKWLHMPRTGFKYKYYR